MTAPAVQTYDSMLPVRFEAPAINPSPFGLYAVTDWQPNEGPSRFLTGVEIRPTGNFPGDQVGVWDAPWCSVPDLEGPRKEGTRRDGLDPFAPVTIWAIDICDLTAPSRTEVEQRAAQALRMRESVVFARQFADRLLTDAAALPGAIPAADDVVAALSIIEGEFAETNVLGYVHASPDWLPMLASAQLLTRSGPRWTTPGGHALVLDGGYRDGLGATMVATSAPLVGWRDEAAIRTSLDEHRNLYVAIAERTVLVGYEAVIGAVTVTP